MLQKQIVPQTFDYQGSEVHVEMDSNGDPWFQASTVCPILGISTKHLRRTLDSDEITEAVTLPNWDIYGHPGKSPLFVNEAGLYTLCLRSNKPEAKPFRRWVTHEVLPSLRKTGVYSLPAKASESDEELLSRAVLVATDKIQQLETANRELSSENEMLKPKAAYADMVGAAENTLTMPQMAKILSSHGFPGGVVKLYRKLREDHVVYRKHGRNLPCQRYVDAGLFTARISPFEAKGHRFNGVTMLVTAKGSRWLAAKYCPTAATPEVEGSEPSVLEEAIPAPVPTWQTACFVEEERGYQGEGYPILHVFDWRAAAEEWATAHNGRPVDNKQARRIAEDIAGLRVEALGWTWDGSLEGLRHLPGSDDARFAQAVADTYAIDAGPWTGGITFHC